MGRGTQQRVYDRLSHDLFKVFEGFKGNFLQKVSFAFSVYPNGGGAPWGAGHSNGSMIA